VVHHGDRWIIMKFSILFLLYELIII
jgi:hypothetical protein